MQEMDSRNEKFPGGGMPPDSLARHAYGVQCAFGMLSPSPFKSLDLPVIVVLKVVLMLSRNYRPNL